MGYIGQEGNIMSEYGQACNTMPEFEEEGSVRGEY
jgi:hypothetical protein